MSKVLYIFKRQVGFAVGYITVNRIREQQYLLSSHTDIRTKYIRLIILDVLSVNIYSALRRIVKSRYKVHQRCFSRTRRAHYYNGFSVPDMKIYIVKHGNISEFCSYVSELYIAVKTGTFLTVMIILYMRTCIVYIYYL